MYLQTENFIKLIVKKLAENPTKEEKWDLLKPFHDGFNFDLTDCAEELGTYCSPISWCDIWWNYWGDNDDEACDIFEELGYYYEKIRLAFLLRNMDIDELHLNMQQARKYMNEITDAILNEDNKKIDEINSFMMKFDMILYNRYDIKYGVYFFIVLIKQIKQELYSKKYNS